MKTRLAATTLILLLACSAVPLPAQQTPAENIVPPMVRFSGTLSGIDGKPLTGTVGVTFLLYKEQTGGAPLWLETQNVQADQNGRYSVMLGAASARGLPADVFVAGDARWLAVQPSGQSEQPRTLLLSVPYALKALDAETIGGKPASAFILAGSGSGGGQAGPQTEQANEIVCSSSTACKTGFVPLFSTNGGSASVTDSILTQSGASLTVAGTETATGNITSGGNLIAGGNVSANGNVGSSTVTTVALTGGVSSTMTGTGNRIAAVQGSATATGSAGFTFGVIGQSASDLGRGVFGLASGATGVGVIGESSGTSGIGVVGKDLSGGGLAFSSVGHASQNRTGGGWAKALVAVEGAGAPYHILRCFNSTLVGSAATAAPCGFNLNEVAFAQYQINFGFEVDDRFWSVSTESLGVGGGTGIIPSVYAPSSGSNTILEVDLFSNGGGAQTTNFTVVIY